MTASFRRPSWAVRAYQWLLDKAPYEFRSRFGRDAVESFDAMLENERRAKGQVAATMLWSKAMADAGGVVRNEWRGATGGVFFGWGRDLRMAARSLWKSRQFSFVVIGTLALAIGGVAAVFTLADPILFRPLPYRDADRQYVVSVSGKGTFGGFAQYPDYFRARSAGVFAATGSFYTGPIVRAADAPDAGDPLLGYAITEGFIETFGLTMQRGRSFSAREYETAPADHGGLDETGAGVVLITDGLWRQLFGRKDDVVGQSLRLRRSAQTFSVTVIGVLRPDFVLPDAVNRAPAFLVPGRLDATAEANPRSVVGMYGRLRSDATVESTVGQLQAVIDGVGRDYPALPQARTVKLVGLKDSLFRRVRVPITLLLGVTLCVLVLAIGNLAHLCLARGAERRREVALRRALGGSAWRIVRLLMTESAILGIAGGVAALGVGKVLHATVMAAVPRLAHIYRLMPSELNLRVVLMVAAVTVVTLLVIGLMPAIAAARTDLRGSLQEGGGRTRGRGRRSDAVLTAFQAALGTSVLVATILLVTSFVRLTQSVEGIDQSGLAMGYVELPREYDTDPTRANDLLTALADRVAEGTGQSIGQQGGVPGLTLPGGLWRPGDAPNAPSIATAFPVDRTAMDAFRLEIVEGRLFSDEEARGNADVAVIDQKAAELLSPGQSALGQMVADHQARPGDRTPRRVVGVVRTVDVSFGTERKTGHAFVPLHPRGRNRSFMWRGAVTPAISAAFRDRLKELEPRASVNVTPFEPFERRFGEPRLLARVTGVLGLLALVLTIAGVYSVTSHTVGGRTGEIGVRMALGATARRVRRMILGEALKPAVLGVVIGLAAAFWWARTIRALLFGVDASDPWAFAASAIVVLLVVAIAGFIPAARASRINPVEALRTD